MPVEQLVLTESVPRRLRITEAQAAALAGVGKRLAGTLGWWGDVGDGMPTETSAIRVRRSDDETWEVRINDAVGLVAVDGLQLSVRPKIPVDHLLPLLALGNAVPRMDEDRVNVGESGDLWDLLVRWFLTTVETVVRQDLVRDYYSTDAELQVVHGRLDTTRTVLRALRGSLAVYCSFDEFDTDTPVNRVLLAGLRAVLASPVLLEEHRPRARRLASRFSDVTALRPGDISLARPDRRMMHYKDALDLARLLLRGATPSLDHGLRPGWAFLLRTPEAVEAGLRLLLQRHIRRHTVTKRALALDKSSKTLNPDLVFDGGSAIGDVKYKLHSGTWENSDLYQVVAFAAGFRADRALLVSFDRSDRSVPTLQVGDIAVSNVQWDAREATTFPSAAHRLVNDIQGWLDAGTETL